VAVCRRSLSRRRLPGIPPPLAADAVRPARESPEQLTQMIERFDFWPEAASASGQQWTPLAFGPGRTRPLDSSFTPAELYCSPARGDLAAIFLSDRLSFRRSGGKPPKCRRGRSGSLVERALLFCLRYDARSGKDTPHISNRLRMFSVVFILGFLIWLVRALMNKAPALAHRT
jgi:hypothetical protein